MANVIHVGRLRGEQDKYVGVACLHLLTRQLEIDLGGAFKVAPRLQRVGVGAAAAASSSSFAPISIVPPNRNLRTRIREKETATSASSRRPAAAAPPRRPERVAPLTDAAIAAAPNRISLVRNSLARGARHSRATS